MYNIPPKYQSNKNNRLRYIDATRGFAIFLVVLGHVLNIGMNNYDENHFLHRLIYSFQYARHEHCLTGESPEQALIAGIV